MPRPYHHPQDLPHILAFVRAVRPPERLGDYPGLTDLQENLSLPEVQQNTRLWLADDDSMLAYAFVDGYDNLICEFAPGIQHTLGAEIVAWAEGIIRARGGSGLDSACMADNHEREAFLLAHGFTRQPQESCHYARPLDLPIPAPSLPPGFIIRPVNGEQEACAVASLHRDAFGTDSMTTEMRLAMMRTDSYDPTMDIVVVAPDGRLAGYTMVFISAAENSLTGRKDGYTDPVAVHPDFQRMGLARALLLAGLAMLKARGMDTARLGTSADNIPMQKAAQAAGFNLTGRTCWYFKPVE